ncbi:hypothetical protein LTR99_004167 [Exophiala xenobiotica]|uniref:Major facilitator superfamily (MFS) profile domain-containing protein n=1 Tax=Vermiconidia calcicola TaxID=1690605 RepID=A0AAV9QIV5_9PEZI|nr:hypothetical protein LTR41_006388 [Exophiala xenobiotica]KAK5545071.1 hypothetical protein LTR25_000078 [Vermiconidia calcicola]KAK5268427.1 hypothetical protein LTR96_006134 [Exophiala xenobiotica]KAK5305101.1 hypothetical protein LTR99_004167 [Exophiala xenobiotica]KAK5336620.1 hypothetical protein LTR98_006926 [Exophiala xenobiotica]
MSQEREKEVSLENGPEPDHLQEKSGTHESGLTTERSSTEQQPVPIEPPKAPYNPWADPSSFPDGGTQAWLTVLGGFCCLFNSWGWINCIGVFQEYYMAVPLSQYSASTVAWIPSVETFFMLACGPLAGYVFDNYGPRYLLYIGTFLHVFGLMMTSISTEYYQFMLSQGVCSAIGACFLFNPAMGCVSTWFFKKRGMAIGIMAAGSSLGGVIFPIIVSHMIRETGFGWAMRTCAFLILFNCIVAILTLRSRIPPSGRKFEAMAFVRPLAELPMLLTTFAVFFFYWGMFPVMSFITTVANGRGMSLQLAQYLVSILNAGSVFGRTLPGILGDKVGRFNVMIVFCTITIIFILGMWIPGTSNAAQIAFALFFGFSSGAAIGLTPAVIAQISPIREIGIRVGTVFAAGSIGALTGSPIAGALISRDHGKYLYMMLFSGCCCIVGVVFFTAGRISIAGVGLKKKV